MKLKEDIQMKCYSISLTRKAKKDIIDIGDYITYTLLEPTTAIELVKRIREKIATLKELPYRYTVIDDEVLERQGIRCISYKNYFVFYQIFEEQDTVVVLRVGYNRRNWKEILRR